jgi:hypothetical protein
MIADCLSGQWAALLLDLFDVILYIHQISLYNAPQCGTFCLIIVARERLSFANSLL